jgi:hypothetical protein
MGGPAPVGRAISTPEKPAPNLSDRIADVNGRQWSTEAVWKLIVSTDVIASVRPAGVIDGAVVWPASAEGVGLLVLLRTGSPGHLLPFATDHLGAI